MQIVHKEEAEKHENGSLIAFEYRTTDKDINGAVTTINGRYPEKGWLTNEECKELIYVLKGSGTLSLENSQASFTAGDVILIEPKEKYFWEGQATHFVATTPPWYPEQHKNVN